MFIMVNLKVMVYVTEDTGCTVERDKYTNTVHMDSQLILYYNLKVQHACTQLDFEEMFIRENQILEHG